jgi:nitrate/nitrite transport system substrate-binding protein
MKRRQFLQYSSLTAAGFTVAACSGSPATHFDRGAVSFGKLEKTDLQIGIVSALDALPLVVAREKGFFKKYGLNVTLVKQPTWEKLQQELSQGKLDAAHNLFAMPLWAHFSKGGKNKNSGGESGEKKDKDAKSSGNSATVALMGLNLNGNSISWSETAWKGGLRPRWDYNNNIEVRAAYSKYIRESKQPLEFAISHPAAMANYLTRYWLGSIGIDAERHLKVQAMSNDQILAGLESGKLAGYTSDELFNQQTLADRKAFTSYVDRDIWSGHPEKILATQDNWLKDHPNTARSLMAAVLEACQYCDVKNKEATTAMTGMLAKPEYTDGVNNKNWQQIIQTGMYNYGGFDKTPRTISTPDFEIFHFHSGSSYLKLPNHANFLWHSHAVWVLTQMVRWHQLKLYSYPKDATELIARLYPTAPYADVSKSFAINLPKGLLKIETPELFIDRMAFDPNKAQEYLNGFENRA